MQEMKGFDEFVSRIMEEWKVPGLAIAVIKDDSVVISEGFGLRDVENDLAVTSETLFAIGSCTKAITAVSMGILVDEGKLDLDKPVREYLPDFRMYDPYVTEHMTPRDLVTHRSGLPRHDLVWYGSDLTRKELFDRLRYLEPSEGFRSVFQYQNLMYMSAGYLAGQIWGGTWEEFVQERILTPLGMENSNFSVTVSQKSSDFALPYAEGDGGTNEIPFRNIDAIGPAGSINSSVTDMIRWILLNLNKGKHGDQQIVSEESLRQIHSPYMVVSEPIKYDELLYASYGMGWGIGPYRGHNMLSHGGGIDGFSALVSMMPQSKIGMVILTNMAGTPIPFIISCNVYDRLLGLDEIDWNQRIKNETEKAKEQAEENKKKADPFRKTGTQPSHPLEDYAGSFENPAYGTIHIEAESDHLKFIYRAKNISLNHHQYDSFHEKTEKPVSPHTIITFSTDAAGTIDSLSIKLEAAVSPMVFIRKE